MTHCLRKLQLLNHYATRNLRSIRVFLFLEIVYFNGTNDMSKNFFFGFPKYPQVFILRLILRDTVRCQGGDLYQESLLHPQGLETETTCLSDQSPFHSGQRSLVCQRVLSCHLCTKSKSQLQIFMDQNYLGETHPKDGSKIMPIASWNRV